MSGCIAVTEKRRRCDNSAKVDGLCMIHYRLFLEKGEVEVFHNGRVALMILEEK